MQDCVSTPTVVRAVGLSARAFASKVGLSSCPVNISAYAPDVDNSSNVGVGVNDDDDDGNDDEDNDRKKESYAAAPPRRIPSKRKTLTIFCLKTNLSIRLASFSPPKASIYYLAT